MNTRIYDWKPVIGSFLNTLTKDEWDIVSASDFHTSRVFTSEVKKSDAIKSVKEICTNVDESKVTFKKGDLGITAYIILGNEPEELISDWGYKNEESDSEFTKSWQKFTAKWEGKKCPTKEIELPKLPL
jgi:hypothetical protein